MGIQELDGTAGNITCIAQSDGMEKDGQDGYILCNFDTTETSRQ